MIVVKTGKTTEASTLLRRETQQELQLSLFTFEQKESPPIKKASLQDIPEIKFPLLEHTQDRSRGWALEASVTSRHNIGNFYKYLYNELYPNNYVAEENAYNLGLIGEERSFQPDLEMDGLLGKNFIEIKARHNGNFKHVCRKAQLENYSFALLRRIYEGDIQPSINYAFFMYGDRKPLKLYSMPSEEAIKTLAKSTRELLIVPLNLALLIFHMSENENLGKNRDSGYWVVSGRLLHKLHEGTLDIPSIIDYHAENHEIDTYRIRRFAKQPNLLLDKIAVRKRNSDEVKKLRFCDTEIKPFPITSYSLTEPDKWNKSFFRNHSKILNELGVRDLYAEWEKTVIPF